MEEWRILFNDHDIEFRSIIEKTKNHLGKFVNIDSDIKTYDGSETYTGIYIYYLF